MKIDVARKKKQAEEFGRYLFKIDFWPNWKAESGQGTGSVTLLPSISTPLGIPRSWETPELTSLQSGFSLPYHPCLCLLQTDIELLSAETSPPVLWLVPHQADHRLNFLRLLPHRTFPLPLPAPHSHTHRHTCSSWNLLLCKLQALLKSSLGSCSTDWWP